MYWMNEREINWTFWCDLGFKNWTHNSWLLVPRVGLKTGLSSEYLFIYKMKWTLIPVEEVIDTCEIFSEPKWLFKYGSNPLILRPSFPFSLRSYKEHPLCLRSPVLDVKDLAMNKTEIPCLASQDRVEGVV